MHETDSSATLQNLWAFAWRHPGPVGQACALLGGLVLLAISLRVRKPSEPVGAHIAQDFAHIVFRALVLVPITAAILGGLDAAVTAWVPGARLDLLGGLPVVVGFAAYVVLVDLFDYGIHRLFHAVPWLWAFHAIHHSQTWVNPLTTTRAHPLEIVIKRVLGWTPMLVLGGPDQPWLAWVALDGFWGFLVHSGLRVPLGPLRWVIVSPEFHAVHHSEAREHHDANFGERLAIWDALFGTARHDVPATCSTGIDDPSFPIEREAGLGGVVRTWIAQFLHPFRRFTPGAPKDARPRRSLLARLGLVVLSMVLTLAIVELGLRLFTEERATFYDFDDELGWAPRPHAEGYEHEEGGAYVRINAAGFRDRDHALVAAPDTFRIAALGDSYTDAIQVPVDSTWWSRLEGELGTCSALAGRPVEVLDFGVRGYGTAQELLTWRRAARAYHPDLTVLLYTPENDLVENTPTLSAKRHLAPFFVLEDDHLVLRPPTNGATFLGVPRTWMIRSMFALRRTSRIAALIDFEALWYRVRDDERARNRFHAEDDPRLERIVTYAQGYLAPDDPVLADAWRVTGALLGALAAETRESGSSLLVVSGTAPIQVFPDREVRAAFARRIGVPDLLESERRVAAIAQRHDVASLALAPILAPEADATGIYFHGFAATHMGIGHWNEDGHRAAAAAIATRICRSLGESEPHPEPE